MKHFDVMGSRNTPRKMMKKMRNQMWIKVIMVSTDPRSEILSLYQFFDEVKISFRLEIVQSLRNIGMSYLRTELRTSSESFLGRRILRRLERNLLLKDHIQRAVDLLHSSLIYKLENLVSVSYYVLRTVN